MCVPVTSMNENDGTQRGEDDVWSPRKALAVESIAKPGRPHCLAYDQLRLRVLRPDQGHPGASFRRAEWIRHWSSLLAITRKEGWNLPARSSHILRRLGAGGAIAQLQRRRAYKEAANLLDVGWVLKLAGTRPGVQPKWVCFLPSPALPSRYCRYRRARRELAQTYPRRLTRSDP
jgi:hypothetical protein